MSSNDILYDIWQSYQASIDCFKIAIRSVERKEYDLLRKTNFLATSPEKVDLLIEKSRSNADDYLILSLWAVFERVLLGYIQRLSKKISTGETSVFNDKVQNKIENEVERWRTDDILDLFKGVVSAELIGNAKQVKKYRDWVAHRNPQKGAPTNVLPKTAYEILSDITSCIESHPELKNIS